MFHLAYHCRELRDALRYERRGSSGPATRQWIRISGGGKEERPLEHRERSGAECERWDGRIEDESMCACMRERKRERERERERGSERVRE